MRMKTQQFQLKKSTIVVTRYGLVPNHLSNSCVTEILKKPPVFTSFFTLRSSLHRSTAKCVRSSTRSSTKKGMFLRIMSSSRSSTEKSYFYTPSLPSVHPPKYEFKINNLREFVFENQ